MQKENIKIIIGPAKTFKNIEPSTNPRPEHILKAKHLFQTYIKPLSLEKTKELYHLSDVKAKAVFQMHQEHGQKVYNAIELFGGLVYQQLQLEKYNKDWLNKHLLIIDPLYGPLKPYETIGLYRLDLSISLPIDLKAYWKKEIEDALRGFKVINLAAKEWTTWLDMPMKTPILDVNEKQIKKARGQKLHELIMKYQGEK